ncbi:MAG: (deoxy)nucleoside triphosphate pyrophosphohydrolase [Bacilli bacterium]|jgi:8-oxo-dGTP diphosphatase
MKTINVVAAIIFNKDNIYATERGYGDFKGWWEFPGGKIEENETREEALIREIKEELNTTISVDKFLTTVEYDYPKFHLHMDCFICKVVSGKLTLLEALDAKWLKKETLDSVNWLPADKIVVESLKKILN